MELYTHPRGPAENITVLSYAFDTATKKNWPVEWWCSTQKGGYINPAWGHLWKDETYPVSYRCIGFQTTVTRVVEWLATGKVTYLLPTAFPKGSISIRDEADYPRSGKTKAIDLPVVLMTIKTH